MVAGHTERSRAETSSASSSGTMENPQQHDNKVKCECCVTFITQRQTANENSGYNGRLTARVSVIIQNRVR